MEQKNENFHISYIPEKGRVLTATRDLPPLSIIFGERPALIAPNHHQTEPVCIQCLQEVEDDSICSMCHFPLCGEECFTSPNHQTECPLLAGLEKMEEHVPNYPIIAILRLLLLRDKDKSVWDQIDQLMDHVEERMKDKEEWDMFQTRVVGSIKQIRPDTEEALLNKLVGIICTNSISFEFPREGVHGRALYPLLSLVSHSCVSNARYTVNPEDFSVVLRAKKEIKEGEEITINYLPPIYGQPNRKLHLTEGWYFNCQCPRCCDVTEFGTSVSALKCLDCREGLILPDSNKVDTMWSCRFCLNPFSPNMIQTLVEGIEAELLSICSHQPTVKILETFVRTNNSVLHPKHFLNLIAQRNIIRLLSQEEKVTREGATKTIRYCKAFKSTLSRLDPGVTEWLGFILKKMNKAQLELLKIDLKERKIDHNSFAEESEIIWKSMREVEPCEILCTPIKFSGSLDY